MLSISRVASAWFRNGSLALGLGLCFPAIASAGIITSAQMFGSQDGTGPGLGTVKVATIITLNPSNDNQAGGGPNDNNITVPVKRFNSVGYIDIVFNVIDSAATVDNPNGTTEYKVFESVDNNTFIPWTSYTIQLGSGTGSTFISTAGDELDFDALNYDLLPSSSAFSNVSTNEDVLVYSTGLHSTGLQSYEFRVDVPNGITSFTIRQTPVAIPEPSLCILGGVAGLLFCSRRIRKMVC